MIRQVKVARDTARKAKTAAIVTLKAMAINAPAPLRESVDGLGDKALIKRCAAYRPGSIDTPTAAAKHALRALARRWVALVDGEPHPNRSTLAAALPRHHRRAPASCDDRGGPLGAVAAAVRPAAPLGVPRRGGRCRRAVSGPER